MSKEADHSIRKYEAMLRMGANGPVTESEIRCRVANYGAAAAWLQATESQVRQILCSHGVSTISFAYYHAYARELGKLQRQELPESMMEVELTLMMDKWSGRGLEREVLRDIAATVFNISLPADEGVRLDKYSLTRRTWMGILPPRISPSTTEAAGCLGVSSRRKRSSEWRIRCLLTLRSKTGPPTVRPTRNLPSVLRPGI